MPYLKSQNMGPGLCLAILIKFFNPLPRKEHILYVLQPTDFYPGILLQYLHQAMNRLKRDLNVHLYFVNEYLSKRLFFFFFSQPSISLCSSQIFILHWGAFQGSLCFQSRFKLQRQLWKVSLESYQFFLDILFSDIILMLLQGVLYSGRLQECCSMVSPQTTG